MTPRLAVTLNAVGLYAISAVLLAAFGFQLILNELPCPLCLLQRLGFVMVAVGPVLTIRHGPRPSHYAVSLLGATAGAAFAIRQILLHIVPPDPGFGTAFLGYHYYTWCFIIFAIAIVLCALVLLFDGQFEGVADRPPGAFERLAVWIVIAVTLLNFGSTFLECGLSACPANPVHYELLYRPA
jgi:disulfide bond formation protein DsbB